jgi:hypothetical protein
MTHPIRLDILQNGRIDRAIFEQVLARIVLQEINLQLLTAAGIFSPRMPLSQVQAWRAEQVRINNLGPISDAERTRITAHERRELNDWANAMQRGAAKQRAGMDAAFLQAAE